MMPDWMWGAYYFMLVRDYDADWLVANAEYNGGISWCLVEILETYRNV